MTISGKQITNAYWPPEHAQQNPSADRKAGDELVDVMTLKELVQFFEEYTAGPTYCLVKERVLTLLDKLPPRLDIIAAKQKAATALETLRQQISRLEQESR